MEQKMHCQKANVECHLGELCGVKKKQHLRTEKNNGSNLRNYLGLDMDF